MVYRNYFASDSPEKILHVEQKTVIGIMNGC